MTKLSSPQRRCEMLNILELHVWKQSAELLTNCARLLQSPPPPFVSWAFAALEKQNYVSKTKFLGFRFQFSRPDYNNFEHLFTCRTFFRQTFLTTACIGVILGICSHQPIHFPLLQLKLKAISLSFNKAQQGYFCFAGGLTLDSCSHLPPSEQ